MKRAGSVKLIITGILSMKVTIESFEWGENDGTGDISYTLSMKEYRTVSIPASVLVKEQQHSQRRPGVTGEHLEGISRRQLEHKATQSNLVTA